MNYKSTASILLDEQMLLPQDKVYYDYLEDAIVLSYIELYDWPTGPGDYNLVYLGKL
jgi:hypothetical protein